MSDALKNEEKMEEKKKFIDGLNTYFKLKAAYEGNINKEKLKISKLPEISWREKRAEFLKIKPKCINCKRPVGSIFSTKTDKNLERQYIALCGDRKTPCPLDIKINLGVVYNITDDIRNDEATINNLKRDIIKAKNDLLFGYITAEVAVKFFDIIKEQVADTTTIYEFGLQNYLNIVDNPEKKAELKKLQLEFYNNLDNFNSMIQQYNTTQNTQLIVDAVELYVTTMHPRMDEIIKKKYSVNTVEYNDDDNTFHLIQIPISIADLETDIGETGQKVISLKMGLEKFAQKKTAKNTKAMSSAIPDIRTKEPDFTKLKTKQQLKPKFVMQKETDKEDSSSDGESEEGEGSDSDEENDPKYKTWREKYQDGPALSKIKIHPNFLPDGTIAASEANNLGLKMEIEKGILIATNPQTKEKYKVTAGR
jgi:hypothetical protein